MLRTLSAALLALASQLTTAHAGEYIIRELAVLPPATSQIVGGFNNRGQVAGAVTVAGAAHQRAFIASDAGLEPIAVRGDWNHGAARDINDGGEVVGYANQGDAVVAFYWTARSGPLQLPPLPGDLTTEAFRINRYGQVVGTSSGDGGIRAVLWSRDGAVSELPGVPKGSYSRALAINSHGDVVGSIGRGPDIRAVLWNRSGAKDLGTLDGDAASEALAINDAGDIVGWSRGATGMRAVLWSSGQIRDLGALNGAKHSRARAINARGEVVGDSGAAHRSRAFLWTRAGGMQDLSALLPTSTRYSLLEALAINDQGEILALGEHENDHGEHAEHRHAGAKVESRRGRAAPVRVFRLVPVR